MLGATDPNEIVDAEARWYGTTGGEKAAADARQMTITKPEPYMVMVDVDAVLCTVDCCCALDCCRLDSDVVRVLVFPPFFLWYESFVRVVCCVGDSLMTCTPRLTQIKGFVLSTKGKSTFSALYEPSCQEIDFFPPS